MADLARELALQAARSRTPQGVRTDRALSGELFDPSHTDERVPRDASVGSPKVAPSAIYSVHVGDRGLAGPDMAFNALSGNEIAADAIRGSEIATDAVGNLEIAPSSIAALEIIDGVIGAAEIAANAVTNSEIADGTIRGVEVAFATLGGGHIADGSLGAADIAANAITASEVADGTIGAAEIANASISDTELVADTILATSIAAGAVGASEIADSSVGAAEIGVGAVAAAEISDTLNGPGVSVYGLRTLGGGTSVAASSSNHTHAASVNFKHDYTLEQKKKTVAMRRRVEEPTDEAIRRDLGVLKETVVALRELTLDLAHQLIDDPTERADAWVQKLEDDPDYRHEFLMKWDQEYAAHHWAETDAGYRAKALEDPRLASILKDKTKKKGKAIA